MGLKKTEISALISTGCGDIVVRLRPDSAPCTVANFLCYQKAGIYDGTQFFRIVSKVQAQAYAPTKIEVIQGGPEFDRAGHDPKRQLFPLVHEPTGLTGLRHTHGAIAMGRFQPGQTYGGFYICVGDQPALDQGGARFPDGQGGAVFGQVVEGLEVIDAIFGHAEADEFTNSPVAIHSISIV